MSTSPGAIPPLGAGHGDFSASAAPIGAVETNAEAKTLGMLCHLLALCGFVIPLGTVLGPLVIWLLKKDQYAFVNDQGKESLNFQITVLIALLVSFALMFLLIGFALVPAVAIAALVLVIMASVKASSGIYYRYPVCLRLIK